MNRFFRKPIVTLSLGAAMLTGTLLPAYAFLDKTRFVADLGIAYYCYHHWVAKPLKDGGFAPGAKHRTGTIVKAGIASLFAVHYVKAANNIAHKSKDPTLHKLSSALDGMAANFQSLGTKFKGKKMDDGDLDTMGSAFGAVDSEAKAQKLDVKDKAIPVPGL